MSDGGVDLELIHGGRGNLRIGVMELDVDSFEQPAVVQALHQIGVACPDDQGKADCLRTVGLEQLAVIGRKEFSGCKDLTEGSADVHEICLDFGDYPVRGSRGEGSSGGSNEDVRCY